MSVDAIFSFADRLSKLSALAQKRRDLCQKIENAQRRCGSCNFWMTAKCPRERQDNKKGHSVGPSGDSMKCQQFSMKQSYIRMLETWQQELQVAQTELADMQQANSAKDQL